MDNRIKVGVLGLSRGLFVLQNAKHLSDHMVVTGVCEKEPEILEKAKAHFSEETKIYDDYGHHPTEILATAKALMNKKYNKSWVVFQPHTYSRTFNHLDDFANALLAFDNIIVTDIYAARETNTYNISSQDLVDAIIKLGKNKNMTTK